MKRVVIAAAALMFLMNTSIVKGEPIVIVDGKTVKMDYTLTVDGEVMDASQEGQPLEYQHGASQIIPGLEKQLAGMKVGDEKTVMVPAAEAYGAVNPEAFQEVPKTFFPPDVEIKVGMIIPLQSPDGQVVPVRVAEIKEESVKLDMNHPLAGKDLTFKIKIVDIQ